MKTDCAGWDKNAHTCTILTEVLCIRRSCPFYKTKEQADAEREKAQKRLSRVAVGNVDNMPDTIAASLSAAGEKPTLAFHSENMKKKKRDRTDYNKEHQAEMIKQGLCPRCGKKNDRPGKFRCTSCAEKEKAYRKARAAILWET